MDVMQTGQPIGCAQRGVSEMLPLNLWDFGYFPRWLDALDDLEAQAQPERWRYPGDDIGAHGNNVNPILDSYLNGIYTRAAALYNAAETDGERDAALVIRHDFAAFDTGLYTPQWLPLICYLARNLRPGERRWYFKGFATPGSHMLARASPLPQRVNCEPAAPWHPSWPIRPNIEHMTRDADNMKRLPKGMKESPNLALLLETAVELARRKASSAPGNVVLNYYQTSPQYLLPISLTDPARVELAMCLEPADGYYIGTTMLTLRMAYANARVVGRLTADWLREVMREGEQNAKR